MRDDELTELLRSIDSPAPQLRADDVMSVARRRRARGSSLIAAAALLIAATAAAAVPGTRIHALVREAFARHASHANPKPQAGAPNALAPAVTPGRGVAFEPEGASRVSFAVAQRSGAIHIEATADASVRVIQTSSGPLAQFTLTPDGVLVNNQNSNASYDVRIPAAAAEVVVRVGGTTVYTKVGDRVSCRGSRGTQGSCIVALGW